MIPLSRARKWAEQIVAELRPYCASIEIAGSIRRERPEVGDIDLVILPRGAASGNSIRTRLILPTGSDQAGWQTIRVLQDGPQNLLLEVAPAVDRGDHCGAGAVQLDIFFARPPSQDLFARTPGTWGTMLLNRTGSMEHNRWLCERAEARGLHWNPCRGLVKGGRLLASETEEEIYAALGLRYLAPREREIVDGRPGRDWFLENIPAHLTPGGKVPSVVGTLNGGAA